MKIISGVVYETGTGANEIWGTAFPSTADDNERTGLEVAGRQDLPDAQALVTSNQQQNVRKFSVAQGCSNICYCFILNV